MKYPPKKQMLNDLYEAGLATDDLDAIAKGGLKNIKDFWVTAIGVRQNPKLWGPVYDQISG